MPNTKPLRRFFINLFTSGRYKDQSEFGISDNVIQYGLLNYMLIGGIIGIGALTAAIGWQWAFLSRLICYYFIFVSFVITLLARTKIRISLLSLIYIIALSLFVIMHIWDGKTHGANFMYVFSIPLASILLLGMLRGIIITVIVGVIISLQLFIPGLSRFDYHSDFALRVILGYFIVSSQMIVIELTRKNKDRKIEIQRKQLDELNRAKRELFANMSHEMRTPLTVMSAYAQFAVEEIRENGANEQTLADLATISSEAKRLAEMADGTLKILLSEGHETETPADEQKIAPVDIGELSAQIARLFEPVAKRNRRALTVAIGQNIPRILADSGLLTQLLWNILQNAIIHSQCQNIHLTVKANGLDVTITIKDDGCGIEADTLPHIFERGTGRHGGSGIGLSICREIAQKHGGNIGIQSGQGQGTTVTVNLHGIDRGH
ncbi:histidine kinase [Treponema sp. R8-4-B8]